MEKVFYILERIYKMTHIPVRYLDQTGELVLFSRGCDAKDDPLLCDGALRKAILDKLKAEELPILEYKDESLYGACRDSVDCHIVLGPTSVRTIDTLCAALASIHFSLTGNYITEVDIITGKGASYDPDRYQSELQATLLDRSEQELPRFNFSDELSYMRHIRDGNPDAIRRITEQAISPYDSRIGKMAQKTIKQAEYTAVVAITLAARNAIDGGLDSITAYTMSDIYLQRLEKCTELPEIYRLLSEVIFGYAERVRQYKNDRSHLSYVEQCKTYINTHLNKRFTVEDIAREIGVNRSHLSRRFSAAEGIGIQQYAMNKRIEAAAKMLKYTDESILNVANYLCFSTQSHFGKVFKERMGMTPQKYRENNMLADVKG